jgi:hypothetical protein
MTRLAVVCFVPIAAIGFEAYSEKDNSLPRRLAPITIRLRWELRVGPKSLAGAFALRSLRVERRLCENVVKQNQRDAGAPLAAELPLSST